MEAPFATAEGTERYTRRFSHSLPTEHFRSLDGLRVSSIGLGTYLGEATEEADEAYAASIREALRLGCNVIDTAINYRCQRSERTIGRALKEAFEQGDVSRSEVVIATKGGFVAFDESVPLDPRRYFVENFVERGICSASDLVAGCHVLTPGYLADQIERSLENLGLECLDIYYIHNPETQFSALDRRAFYDRLRQAFCLLEEAVAEGKIRRYGAATWKGFRIGPQAPDHLSLEAMVSIAREVAGEGHHFRVVQLPYNLVMTEAFFEPTQSLEGRRASLIEAAGHFGISTVASASLLQAQLVSGLPPPLGEVFLGLQTDAQRALQFVRSTPGISVALVGMARLEHVRENLAACTVAPLSPEEFLASFRP